MKDMILKEIDKCKEELWKISDYIYRNPELGNHEFKSAKKLIDFLEKNNFKVKEGVLDKSTAFIATFDSDITGPNIGYLCEYDALPSIGHGCGHNMIGTMSVGAAAILSKFINKTGGKITVFGTPAEECDGAKVEMAAKGIFNDIDVAMIIHPAGETYESGSSLAMDALQFSFKGKASHAAASPEEGINALDGVILTFNGINALRQHVTSDVRIHGIIKEGGVAANIVPEIAVAQFYIRASTKENLKKVAEKVKNIANGASLMTGASLDISNYEISYEDMKTNQELSLAFTKNLKYSGVINIHPPKSEYGSADMGNVSYIVPSIHPYIGLSCPEISGHTREFAAKTITLKGHEALIQGASALALTGYDILTDNNLLDRIKDEFYNSTHIQ